MNNLPMMEIIMPQQPTGNVPAFLAKLWKMVDNPETDLLICWSDEGTSFLIRNQADFTKQMLPYYYKHSNMASFVRQLNMYGFHKVMSVDSGGLKGEKDETEFAHPYFMRGQEHLLDQIKRKVSVAAARPGPGVFLPSIKSEKVGCGVEQWIRENLATHSTTSSPGMVNEVLTEVSLIKDRQEDLDGKLDTMKNENEALWREVLSLRQKHTQQQKIVNKLIQFLVALVQPRMGGAMKRRYATVPGLQLAIEEGGGSGGPSPAKEPRLEESGGPVIQELAEPEDMGEMTGTELQDFLNISQEVTVTTPDPLVEQPPLRRPAPSPAFKQEKDDTSAGPSQSKYRLVDPASVNPALIQQVVKSELKRPVLHREISKEDFDLDINSMQKELDNLKEILSGQITLDTSLVSSLFNTQEDGMPNMNLFNETLLNQEEEASVSHSTTDQPNKSVVTYNPSLFELTEDDPSNSEVLMDPPSSASKQPNSILPTSGINFDVDLNTPLVTEDTTDPLIRLLYKK